MSRKRTQNAKRKVFVYTTYFRRYTDRNSSYVLKELSVKLNLKLLMTWSAIRQCLLLVHRMDSSYLVFWYYNIRFSYLKYFSYILFLIWLCVHITRDNLFTVLVFKTNFLLQEPVSPYSSVIVVFNSSNIHFSSVGC